MSLCTRVICVLMVAHWASAIVPLDIDMFGEFSLEQGSLPFCLPSLQMYPDYRNVNQLGSIYISDVQSSGLLAWKTVYCNAIRGSGKSRFHSGTNLTRTPASTNLLGSSVSSFGGFLSPDESIDCTISSYGSNSVSLEPSAEPGLIEPSAAPLARFNYSDTKAERFNNTKFTVAFPTTSVTVKGVLLSPEKRYLFIENRPGFCIYSAPLKKRLPVQATYNLVLSPLLKTPPSFCKSRLQIGGKGGLVKASDLLFDGHADPCLKGTLEFVQQINITFPVFTKMVQDAIPYYGYSQPALRCGNRRVYAGAAEISRDGVLANVATVKGAKYFGLIELPSDPPYLNPAKFLREIGICLYTTAPSETGGFWGGVQSALN